MGELVEVLAKKVSRRRVLIRLGKATAMVAGISAGLLGSTKAAHALGCPQCSGLPNCSGCFWSQCPSGCNWIWSWTCCVDGCIWECADCDCDGNGTRDCLCGGWAGAGLQKKAGNDQNELHPCLVC